MLYIQWVSIFCHLIYLQAAGIGSLSKSLFVWIVAQIPLDQAFDMMLTGKNIRPSKAKKLGLIDVVVNSLGN